MRACTNGDKGSDEGGDKGVATVWVAGITAVLVSMAVFGLQLGAAMVARH